MEDRSGERKRRYKGENMYRDKGRNQRTPDPTEERTVQVIHDDRRPSNRYRESAPDRPEEMFLTEAGRDNHSIHNDRRGSSERGRARTRNRGIGMLQLAYERRDNHSIHNDRRESRERERARTIYRDLDVFQLPEEDRDNHSNHNDRRESSERDRPRKSHMDMFKQTDDNRDNQSRILQRQERKGKRTSESPSHKRSKKLRVDVEKYLKMLRDTSQDVPPSLSDWNEDYRMEQVPCRWIEEQTGELDRPRSSETLEMHESSTCLERPERSVSLERFERSKRRSLSPCSNLNKTIIRRKHQDKKSDRRNDCSTTPQSRLNKNLIPSGISKTLRDRNHDPKRRSMASRGRETGNRIKKYSSLNKPYQVTGRNGEPPNGSQVYGHRDDNYSGPPYQEFPLDILNGQSQNGFNDFQPGPMLRDVRDDKYLEDCHPMEREDIASDIFRTLCNVFEGKTDLQKLRLQLLSEGIVRFSNAQSLYMFVNEFEVFRTSGDIHLDAVEEGEVVDVASHDNISIEGSPNLQLCITHSRKAGSCNEGCDGLHICKYFILGKCEITDAIGKSCLFGHDMNTQHNKTFMRRALIHNFPPMMLKQLKYRNLSTVPLICQYYNRPTGCSKTNCPFLHVCQKFILGECQPYPPCNLTHDLKNGQASNLLSKYGIAPTNPVEEHELVTVLTRIEHERKHESSKPSKGFQGKKTREISKAFSMNGKPTEIQDATTNHLKSLNKKQFGAICMRPTIPSGKNIDLSETQPFAAPAHARTTSASYSNEDHEQGRVWKNPALKTAMPSGPKSDKPPLDRIIKTVPIKDHPKEQPFVYLAKETFIPSGPSKDVAIDNKLPNPAGAAMPSCSHEDRRKDEPATDRTRETLSSSHLNTDHTNDQVAEKASLKVLMSASPLKDQPVMDSVGTPLADLTSPLPEVVEDEDLDATNSTDWHWAWKAEDGDWTEVDDCYHFEERYRAYHRAQRMKFTINKNSSEINFSTMKGHILGESRLQFRRMKKEQDM